MEKFDLYDKLGNKLDKTMYRGGTNTQGEYHLVVHVWIRNKDGEYLIQQRNKTTDLIPNQWGCTSGAVIQNETSIDGALREVKEEIGLNLTPEDLTRIKRYVIDHPKSNYITDVYLVEKDVRLSSLQLDHHEVKAVTYKTLDQIETMVIENTFWNYARLLERRDYFDLLKISNERLRKR
ncbi:MAG: NUDIX domain-containing protein [Candidatus Izemoplasma sp.]|nr:NUDIX domain-containing protein [Candidatus Izemoplasma sp.]